MSKVVNYITVPDNALVLDQGVDPSNEEPYVIWAIPFPGGWRGQPALVLQITNRTQGRGGAILTRANLEAMARLIQ